MAVPVQLEIFMKDLTRAGLQSAGKNVKDVEQQTQLLISALEQVRAQQLHQLDVNKEAGLSYTQEAANVQALTGQINGLKTGLKDLQKTKEDVVKTPNPKVDVDTDAVERKTNNLKMRFSQVARELPSLAMGPQMFFLAISNNLPMLTDAIADVRKQNELLKASGQNSVPVWKQLGSALFSWQTALVAAITLLVVYGKDFTNWIKTLGKGKKELSEMQKIQEALGKSQLEGSKAALDESNKLRILYNATQDTNKSLNERNKAVDELQKKYPSYFGQLSNEEVLAGKASDAYDRLTQSIISSARARAAMNMMVEEQSKVLDNEQKINDAYARLAEAENDYRTKKAIYDKGLEEGFGSASAKIDARYDVTMAGVAVKKIEKEISEYRKSIYESQKLVKELEKNIQADDLITDSGTGGAINKQDYATQLSEARLKAQQTVERLRIQIMIDGKEKRRALAEQEYREAIADIDRTEKATIAKLDKSKKQGDTVTEADYKEVRDSANRQRILQQLALSKELQAIDNEYYTKAADAMIAYNKQYGTLQEKKAAIAAEYSKKIFMSQSEGERKSLQNAYKREIQELNFNSIQKSLNLNDVFGNIDVKSTESLKTLKDKLSVYLDAAVKDLQPEDVKELQDAFRNIEDELLSRETFTELRERAREMTEAASQLRKAKEELDYVNKGGKITTGIKAIRNESGEIVRLENTYLSAEQAVENYNKAKDKSEETTRNYTKAENKARETIDKLATSLSQIGDTIGGQAGEILSLIGDITSFASSSIEGISKVTQTGASAISAIEKASVILGLISSAIQIMQKISELGNNVAYKQYEDFAQKIDEINALTDAVSQYTIAVSKARIEENSWFGSDNLQNLKDYKELQDEVMKAYVKKAMEAQAIYQNESGGGWLTGAFNWVMGNLSILSWWDKWRDLWGQGDYAEGTTAAINNLRIETRKKSSGILWTGIGGHSQKTENLVIWARNQGLGELFDEEGLINKELAQSLIDNYGNKLVGQTKETLEELIELREQYDEYIEQLHEYVASLYDPLVDNFVDSMWDWFDNGKNALDSFKEYASSTFRDIVTDMLKTIVLEKVVGTFGDDIASLYEKYASGKLSEEELMQQIADRTEGLIGDYEDNIPALQQIMQNIAEMLKNAGIDIQNPTDTNVGTQSPTSGALTTMSQESIATFEGIGRSMQTHLISIDKVSIEIRDQQREDSKALVKIVENTSHLGTILGLLEKFDRDGIKVK